MSRVNNTTHTKRLKEIRPYINFNYNLNKPLTAYAKRKIKKYHDALVTMTARPNRVYRPRDKKKLKTAMVAAGGAYMRGFNAVFVEVNPSADYTKIKTDNGFLVTVNEHTKNTFLPLNMEKLLTDPGKHTRDVIDQVPHIKHFSLLARDFEILSAFDAEGIIDYVVRMLSSYGAMTLRGGEARYRDAWILGLTGHEFRNQYDFFTYQSEKRKAITAMVKETKARKKAVAKEKEDKRFLKWADQKFEAWAARKLKKGGKA